MCRPLSSLLQYCLQHKQYIDILTVKRLCYPCHDFIALFHSKKLASVKYFLSTIHSVMSNRPHSIYQYSNMAQRLSTQTSIFGLFSGFVSESLLGNGRQKKLLKIYNFDEKPQSLNMLEYRTWPIQSRPNFLVYAE